MPTYRTRPCGCKYRIAGRNTRPTRLCEKHKELYAMPEAQKALADARKATEDREKRGG